MPLGPLSAVGVLFYLASGKAEFHVTADPTGLARRKATASRLARVDSFRIHLQRLISGSHPDHFVVQGFEILCGVILGLTCLKLFQISFFGITKSGTASGTSRSEEHTSELQSRLHLVCRLLLEKKKKTKQI